MIFWFSGSGNSYAVAKDISRGLGEKLVPVARAMELSDAGLVELLSNETSIGFVYPVYAWGPPRLVTVLAKRLGCMGQVPSWKNRMPFVFSVSTCGDEEGHATSLLEKGLARVGLMLDSAFTLQMPNNYVIGYDVDPADVAEEKLMKVSEQLSGIIAELGIRRTGLRSLMPGRFGALKTYVINPLFNRFAMDATRFTVSDACTRCGLCESLCPTRNIALHEGRPVWGNRCTQCLACLHHCPVLAINYGRGTVKKGRYVHPQAYDMKAAMK